MLRATSTSTRAESAADALSGLASVSHRVGSGAWSGGASVLVSVPGTHTVSFEARDTAGNLSSESVLAVVETSTTLSIAGPAKPVPYGKSATLSGVDFDFGLR